MHILVQNDCQLFINQDDAAPMAMAIYHWLESLLDTTASTIIRRIVADHEAYQVTNVIRWLWVICMHYAA